MFVGLGSGLFDTVLSGSLCCLSRFSRTRGLSCGFSYGNDLTLKYPVPGRDRLYSTGVVSRP